MRLLPTPGRPTPHDPVRHSLIRRVGAVLVAAALAVSPSAAPLVGSVATVAAATPTCSLGANGAVKHVIYVQFDNTHLLRDRPNVPSDLEQMPNLLNFMRNNGTLLSNDHTILISHTAGGILSSLTGVYPDRHGQTVSNSYVRTSSTGGFSFPLSFGYWTDPVSASGTPIVPNMITPTGAVPPAPWVPYTRAGCDWGGVATANTVLENNNAVFVTGRYDAIRRECGRLLGQPDDHDRTRSRFGDGHDRFDRHQHGAARTIPHTEGADQCGASSRNDRLRDGDDEPER